VNFLLAALAKECQKNMLREKILVVPSYQSGHVLCESLSLSGTGWVNLRTETPTGIALRIAGEHLAAQQITLISDHQSAVVVEGILLNLSDQGSLIYFCRQQITQGLAESLSLALMEMRMCGVKSDALIDDYFICPEKGQDIKLLLREYEDYLQEHHYLDHPGVITLALALVPDYQAEKGDSIYLVPSFYRWEPQVENLVKSLAGDLLHYLPVETTSEIDQPVSSDLERLKWLSDPENAPSPVRDGSVSFFHSYGIVNELREVLRQVQREQIPFDQVSIAYTTEEYVAALYSLSQTMGFGLTVFEGIPAPLTGPGRALQGLTSWFNSGFSAAVLCELIQSGDLILWLEDKYISPFDAVELLRDAGIGWGRERYRLLEQQESETAQSFSSLINLLLKQIPAENDQGKISFCDFCSGLAEILRTISSVEDEQDKAALSTIISCLEQTAAYSSFELGLEGAVERIANMLGKLRVGNAGPKPGQLHLTGYRNLIWSDRPYTFIVGLDADTFPGALRQAPVLLDSERLIINPELRLGVNKLEENQFDMATAISSRRRHLVLSYSSFDVVESQEHYPASLLLRIYRLLEGDQSLDYSDLLNFLGQPVGYCSQRGEESLDEVEWWLYQALEEKLQDSTVVEECYTNIKRGRTAARARQESEPTVYDGALNRVDIPVSPWIPRKPLSCSQLEYLATCPFGYFLRYALQLEPPKDLLYDPSRWLDPLQRGNLLHSVFCDFMRKIIKSGERVDEKRHKNLIYQIALQLIDIYKEQIPIPSELVFQCEVNEILESCDFFLAIESRRESTPLFFEVPFGLGEKEATKAGCGLAEPIRLDLGHGRILSIRGRIDRIDRISEDCYSVWDYKTGKGKAYGDEKFYGKGRQIQHAIYAIAAEEILKALSPGTSPRVMIAGYLFPSKKGEGRQVHRKVNERESLFKLLNTMYEIIEKGTFVASHDNSHCTYCDYAEVCNQDAAAQRAKYIFEYAVRLDPWRRLQNYD
jgi:RecB family exonuclease